MTGWNIMTPVFKNQRGSWLWFSWLQSVVLWESPGLCWSGKRRRSCGSGCTTWRPWSSTTVRSSKDRDTRWVTLQLLQVSSLSAHLPGPQTRLFVSQVISLRNRIDELQKQWVNTVSSASQGHTHDSVFKRNQVQHLFMSSWGVQTIKSKSTKTEKWIIKSWIWDNW